jgi:hypothetical protein
MNRTRSRGEKKERERDSSKENVNIRNSGCKEKQKCITGRRTHERKRP